MTFKRLSPTEIKTAVEGGRFVIDSHVYRVDDANIYALLVLERRVNATHSLALPLRESNALLALSSHLNIRIKRAKEEILAAGKKIPEVATVSGRSEPIDANQLTNDAISVNTNRALIKAMRKPVARKRLSFNPNRVGKFVCPCGSVFYRPYFRLSIRSREGHAYCGKSCQYKYSKSDKLSTYLGQGYLSKDNEFTPMSGESI